MANRKSRTRTITRYRSARRSFRRKSGLTLPLAIVGGMAPLAIDGIEGFKINGVQGALELVSADLTGFSFTERNWTWQRMTRGWVPLLLGVLTHKLAGRLGLNAALARNNVPFIRI